MLAELLVCVFYLIELGLNVHVEVGSLKEIFVFLGIFIVTKEMDWEV